MPLAPKFFLHLIGYILPLVTIAISIPLVLGAVPPNRFYGFRTPKTLSSPQIWYPANRVSGWYMIAASVASLLFNLSFWMTHRHWPVPILQIPLLGGTIAPLMVSLVASLVYLRKL